MTDRLAYNLLLDTDSYKLSHFQGYRPGTTRVYSYIESRGGEYPATIFFGLQRLLQQRLAGEVVSQDKIDEAAEFATAHGLPFNREGWEHILKAHGGRLPIKIKAVPEGLLVPTRNALLTIENTDDKVPWLTSYLETLLLRDIWYGSTVATRIFYMKQKLKRYFDTTSDAGINPFALLDFSSRGCAGLDANLIGGGAYLTSFMGSDSVPAVRDMNHHYAHGMAGFSVPATEHSIMCSYGRSREEETAAFRQILASMGTRGGILSVVSDTWDVFRAANIWGGLAQEVKDAGVTLVFRPDSGEPKDVLPAVLAALDSGFGHTINAKGYRVLDGVKVLWGDGIDEETCTLPHSIANGLGYSSDSIILGSGGGLMQVNINRDTCKWAMKASEMVINGERVAIYKDPVTDAGKQSKKGRFALLGDGHGKFTTVNVENDAEDYADLMELRFLDGEVIEPTTLDQIRERVDAQL